MEIQSPLHSGRPERRPVNRQDVFTSSFVAQLVKNPPAMEETGFDSWIRKIPWRKKWQHTPVFLPGKSHGQRSLAGYSL